MAGVVTSDPVEINKILSSFYSNLYSSQCPPVVWNGDNPLDKIIFPKINVDLCRELGGPIPIKEVQEAVMSFQNGKSPGPCRRPPFLSCLRVTKTLSCAVALGPSPS